MKKQIEKTFTEIWFDKPSTRNSSEGNPIKDSFIFMTNALELYERSLSKRGWNIPDFPGMGAIRMTFFHEKRMSILGYCEGDLSLIECPDLESFEKEKESYCKFYEEEN